MSKGVFGDFFVSERDKYLGYGAQVVRRGTWGGGGGGGRGGGI